MTAPGTEDLRQLLAVWPDDDDPAGGWRLRGRDQPHPADRVFGGLQLAQAVSCAAATAPEAHVPIGLQADFLAGVPVTGESSWRVDDLGTSPGTSARRADLLDDGRSAFTCVVRLGRVREDLPGYSEVRPRECPPPDDLVGLPERYGEDERVPPWWSRPRPVDFRHVETPAYTAPVSPAVTELTMWWRTPDPMDDPVLVASCLAYVADMSVLEPAFRRLGSARHLAGSRILSMSHSMVFHALPRLDGWMQMDCRVEVMSHGRALGVAEIFTAGGEHVATVSQLGLIKTG
ncbi:acyl-CoA thioesterase [Janibacter melonis]|uniref:acyl-CoA thioesterase n=1 Tax=Janibacter melonis TaxID=262209 RepID=UPI00191959EB|nr:acyl-CoA thioesterase domain-containing protein [Janibacter melonis]